MGAEIVRRYLTAPRHRSPISLAPAPFPERIAGFTPFLPLRTLASDHRYPHTRFPRASALTLILLAFLLMLLPDPGLPAHAQKRKPRAAAKSGKSAPAKKKPGARSIPKSAPKPKKIIVPLAEQIRPDSTYAEDLADGIAHRWITTTSRQTVNVVTIDLKKGARLRSYKALGRCDGLQNARDIGEMAAGEIQDTVVAATNASFWRAGSNTPIGATITGGEIVEMPGYKRWSSLMIHDDGSASIDRIELRGELFWKQRHFTIGGVNRRGDVDGVVVYNRFYGDSIPRGSRKSDSAIIAEAVANKVGADVGDETETIDTTELIRSYRTARVKEDAEHPLLKIACRPIAPRRKRDPMPAPSVGDTMKLIVTAIDTGVVERPENGYVISTGTAAEWFTVIQPGDTVRMLYTLAPAPGRRVEEALTGTPRLVRDGRDDPEYEIEGSKARRFIDGKLARTAVGISRGGDTLFLVTVSSPSESENRTGMTLAQLAAFMRSIGAYQAMNFDGGGSASMAIQGEMISRQGNRPTTRRVSNALLAVRPIKPKKKGAK